MRLLNNNIIAEYIDYDNYIEKNKNIIIAKKTKGAIVKAKIIACGPYVSDEIKVGDIVLIPRYVGQRLNNKYGEKEYNQVILKEEHIIAIVEV